MSAMPDTPQIKSHARTHAPPPVLDAAGLRALATAAPNGNQPVPTPCRCGVGPCPAWESVPEERWPKARVQQVGTLRPADGSDPGFEEYHPNGTRYASPEAPIAPAYFPYHRCDVFSCTDCQRLLLRYTEYGGYYVDHRVREVVAERVVGTTR